MEHPLQPFSTEQALKTIEGKELMFTPGSRHYYTNTNYELLALIANAVCGDRMQRFISRHIFEPLAWKHMVPNDPHYSPLSTNW